MADQRISQLAALLQADVDAAADQLPIADVSTAETKKVTPAALVSAVVGTLSGAIPGTAIAPDSLTAAEIAPDAITASELAAGAVDTAALLDKAVTAAKIADHTIGGLQIAAGGIGSTELAAGGVSTAALADGAVTSPKLGNGAVDANKLAAQAVTSAKVADGAIGTTQLADGGVTAVKLAGDLGGAAFAVQNSGVVLAGPATGAAAKPTFRALTGTDLPVATATTKGGVSLLAGGGLSVGTGGELSITNAVVAATNPVVTYDSKGLVTAGRALVSADLPKAAVGAIGGVEPGAELTVATPGTLDHAASGVAPGVYSKVTVNKFGHVTTGATLQSADVPTLDASKIGTGTLDPARIGDKSITNAMLADYSIAYIQEASPSVAGQHAGTLWLQESTGQLRMFNSNSWFPVGFGRLSAENLRYCGTFNAATGAISGVTQFGTTEGFKIGDVIPSATDPKSGVYFVCVTPGNATPVAAGVTFDNGDWVLCNGATAGWVRVDTLSGGGGGGGGGGATGHLDDLLDVTLTAPVVGDQLVLGAGSQWINKAPATSSLTAAGLVQLATQAEVDAGTNALKAVTPKTLQDAVLSCGTF